MYIGIQKLHYRSNQQSLQFKQSLKSLTNKIQGHFKVTCTTSSLPPDSNQIELYIMGMSNSKSKIESDFEKISKICDQFQKSLPLKKELKFITAQQILN